MLPHFTSTFLLTGSFVLVAAAAHAQPTFSIGPQLGLNVCTTPFAWRNPIDAFSRQDYHITALAGIEAGMQGCLAFNHLEVRAGVLFSQKGLQADDTETRPQNPRFTTLIQASTSIQTRLNYLTLPINVAYTLKGSGNGFQIFAGPYVSWLLNGLCSYDERILYSTGDGHHNSIILPLTINGPYVEYRSGRYSSYPQIYSYSRQADVGFQTGVGYRAGKMVLLQLTYSQGLQNQGVSVQEMVGNTVFQTDEGPRYYNRTFQSSLTLLIATKRKRT